MGKETKIGLAVIAILLVTFGVVLAKRLTTPGDSPLVLLDSNQPAVETTTGAAATDSFRAARRPKPQAAEKTTVMAAEAAPTKTAGSKPSAELGKWTVAVDKSTAQAKQSAQTGNSLLPPLMPKSEPVRSGQHNGATDKVSLDRVSAGGPPPGRVDPAPKSASYDPLRATTATTTSVSYPVSAPASDHYAASDHVSRDRSGLSAPANPYRSRNDNSDRRTRYAEYDSPQRQSASSGDDSRDPYQMPPPVKPIAAYTPRRTSAPATAMSSRTVRDAEGNYVVQPNDSYWTISEKVYGAGGYFRALAEWNSRLVPNHDKLNVGDAIRTPKRDELERSYPDLCPDPKHLQAARGRLTPVSTSASYSGGRTYVVEEGDTLYGIARYELGVAARWAEIYELNRNQLGEDFDYLTPGTKLVLPNDGGGAFTRRPTDAVNR